MWKKSQRESSRLTGWINIARWLLPKPSAGSDNGASPIVFGNINFERRAYDPSLAYGPSKTANALFAVGATRRWASDGILSNSLMPGGIWTNLQRY